MRSLFYANLFARKPADSVTGSSFSFPKLIAGQQWTLALRFSDRVAGSQEEVFPIVKSIRASIGTLDARPASGTVKWQIGGGISTAANTTEAIDWNTSAHDIEGLLNDLSGFEGAGFKVEEDSGSYLVTRGNGALVAITLRANRLNPISAAPPRERQVDGVWITEVRYTQLPIVFTDTAEQVLPKAPYIETVLDGATSVDGTYKQNEVQNLFIPPDFRGQYYLRRGYNKTQLLSIEDGAEEIQTAYNALLALEGGSVAVTNPDTGIARMVYGGALSGVDVAEPEVIIPVEGTPPGDWTLTLDANKAEVWTALREKPEITLLFEIEIEVPKDDSDPEGATKIIKLWRESIVLAMPQMYDGLATAQNIDWLRPASRKDYRRFSPSTIIHGQSHHVEVFGDGETEEPVIDHNLGTSDYSGLEVIDNDTGRFLVRGTEYQVSESTENSLTLAFTEAPSEDSLVVVITTAGPVSAFINELQIEIDQVNGLPEIIEDFGARLVALEAVLPSTGPGATTTSGTGLVTLLPEISEILFLPTGEYLKAGSGLDVSKLPERAPYMLPALHDATIDTLPTPLPAVGANAGKVYKNETGTAKLIPSGGSIPSRYAPDDGYVACDGRSLFVVERDGATNSYFPAAFEKTLFTMAVNDKQLAVGRTLQGEFSILLQLARALRSEAFFCQAQWVFRLEIGTAPQQSSPDPVGLNLENIVWADSPIFEQRIVLDPLFRAHPFGVRIQRLSGGIKLDQQVYGIWSGNNDAAPGTANFVLRGKMGKFDTENNQSRARGFVYVGLSGGLDDSGAVKDGAAKFVIS